MNKALYAAPYLITILTVINTVAQYKTGLRTYALVGVPCLIICLLLYLSQPAKNPLKVSSQRLLLFFLWIGLLFCGESLLGTLHKNESLAIKAIFSIAWAPLFWIFFVPLANSFDWQRFAKFQVLVGLLVAALGFVQRFYSLNLFGMVPNVKWHDHFSSHMGMYRVTSVLSSPQVYGLYCAIMAVVAASCFPKWSKKLSWGIFGVLSVAGLLSGNKSVTVLLLLFALLKANIPSKAIVVPALTGVLLLAMYSGGIPLTAGRSQTTSESVTGRSFDWIRNIPQLIERERRGRIVIYSTILERTNLLFGNGLGCTAPDNGRREVTPESHIFLLLAEAGLPAILLFVGTMFALYSEATRFGDPCQRYVIVLVGVASCFVHAITYPAFFGIWGILLGGTRQRVLKKKTRRPAQRLKRPNTPNRPNSRLP